MEFRSLYILYERQRDTRKKFVENPVHGNRRVGASIPGTGYSVKCGRISLSLLCCTVCSSSCTIIGTEFIPALEDCVMYTGVKNDMVQYKYLYSGLRVMRTP